MAEGATLLRADSTATQGLLCVRSAEETTATDEGALPLALPAAKRVGAPSVASFLTGTPAQAPDSGAGLPAPGSLPAATAMPGHEVTSHQTLTVQAAPVLRTGPHRTARRRMARIRGGNQTRCTGTRGLGPTPGGRRRPIRTGIGPERIALVGATWGGAVRTVGRAEALGIRTDSFQGAQGGERGPTLVRPFGTTKMPLERTRQQRVALEGGAGTGMGSEGGAGQGEGHGDWMGGGKAGGGGTGRERGRGEGGGTGSST